MTTHCKPEFFAGNRRELRRRLPNDAVIVIPSAGIVQRTGDTCFPFVQDSNFLYLTGVDQPDLVLVLTSSDEYLVTADRSESRQAFDGQIDTEEITRSSGGLKCLSATDGWRQLRHDLQTHPGKAFSVDVPPAYSVPHGMFTNPHRRRVIDKCRRLAPDIALSTCTPQLIAMRAIKQPPELAALQAAIDTTCQAIDNIRQDYPTLTHEYEVEARLSHDFRIGGEGHGFAPIVANGKHATTLHYVANNGRLDKAALTVIDVGAAVEHYNADVTRTVAYGRPTARQRAVHQAVLEVQQFALSLLRPGVQLRSYESEVRSSMAEKLLHLGLITSVRQADHIARYYPHATSHFLGLDVHDVGDYRQPLKENMVLTCEPGIYIPEEAIGVRIEDDVLITSAGNQVLSSCTTAL